MNRGGSTACAPRSPCWPSPERYSRSPAAASAERPSVGISDQEAGTYVDPLLNWTGISRTRIIVPWDVAFVADNSRFDRVLSTAHHTYQDILVSFEHRSSEDCAEGRCYLPNPTQYRFALAAFHQRWPYVKTISPWNEANHPVQPTAEHPAAAAEYYRIARSVCPECTVLGAEVVDLSNLEDWLGRYKAAARSTRACGACTTTATSPAAARR